MYKNKQFITFFCIHLLKLENTRPKAKVLVIDYPSVPPQYCLYSAEVLIFNIWVCDTRTVQMSIIGAIPDTYISYPCHKMHMHIELMQYMCIFYFSVCQSKISLKLLGIFKAWKSLLKYCVFTINKEGYWGRSLGIYIEMFARIYACLFHLFSFEAFIKTK